MINDQYEGIYFSYSTHHFQAFRNTHTSSNTIIYITGLGGKLLSDPLALSLFKFCNKHKYSFVQPILRSHPYYGLYTLKDDNDELQQLLKIYYNSNIILVGWSTGCQNIIMLNLSENLHNYNIKTILVGPVSDREYLQKYTTIIDESKLTDIFMCDNVVMTRERYKDLYYKNGMDDIFSSDLGNKHFEELNPMCWNLTFIICGCDEFVVNDNSHLLELVPNSKVLIIEDADHCLSNEKDIIEFEKILMDVVVTIFE